MIDLQEILRQEAIAAGFTLKADHPVGNSIIYKDQNIIAVIKLGNDGVFTMAYWIEPGKTSKVWPIPEGVTIFVGKPEWEIEFHKRLRISEEVYDRWKKRS